MSADFLVIIIILILFHPGVWSKHVTSPKWIPWEDTIRNELFSGGVSSGANQTDAIPTYIARVHFDGGEIVQNVLDLQKNITFLYGRTEHTTSEFDLLVYPQGALIWVEVVTLGKGSCLPRQNAMFPGGVDPASRETLYLCRAWHKSNLVVGKFLKNLGAYCEVDGGDGDYQKYKIFDILVKHDLKSCPEPTTPPTAHKREVKADWVPSTLVNITDLFQAGLENGVPYYIGRTTLFGGTVPGKVKLTNNGTAFNFSYSFSGVEHQKKTFDMLVYPPGALTWVQVATLDYTPCLPPNMFPGGVDPRDDSIFYICRVTRGVWEYRERTIELKHFVVGKFSKKSGSCQAGSGGSEVYEHQDFDVLVENDGGGTCFYPGSSLGSSSSEESSSSSAGLIVGVLALVLILLVGGGFGVAYYFGWFGLQSAVNTMALRLRRAKSESVARFNNTLTS